MRKPERRSEKMLRLQRSIEFTDKMYSAETLSSALSATAQIRSMTQEQYDGLSEKDENTIYVIVNS